VLTAQQFVDAHRLVVTAVVAAVVGSRLRATALLARALGALAGGTQFGHPVLDAGPVVTAGQARTGRAGNGRDLSGRAATLISPARAGADRDRTGSGRVGARADLRSAVSRRDVVGPVLRCAVADPASAGVAQRPGP